MTPKMFTLSLFTHEGAKCIFSNQPCLDCRGWGDMVVNGGVGWVCVAGGLTIAQQ